MIDSIGVPKHSDLEPHHFLVKGNRGDASKRGLMARRLRKHGFPCSIISSILDWNQKCTTRILDTYFDKAFQVPGHRSVR